MFGARPAVTDRDIHVTYDFTGPVLGKGSFATVLRVRDRVSGSEYAVKQVCVRADQAGCLSPTMFAAAVSPRYASTNVRCFARA